MRGLWILALAAVALVGCSEAPAPVAPAPKDATNNVENGAKKDAKGMSPDALSMPGDGKGNFGSKANGN